MSASNYDFTIEQGSSFKLKIVYKDNKGIPVDITNWCARLVWITSNNITQNFVSTNTDLSTYKYIIDGPNGSVTLFFPASVTNSFDFETAKYDLELQSDDDYYSGGGKYIVRILYGTVKLLKRYSQSNNILECN